MSYAQSYNNNYLKPSVYAETTSINSQDSSYQPVAPDGYSDYDLHRVETQDAKLKQSIRTLRIVSRVLAVILSAAIVVPLSITLAKYFETRNTWYTIDGVRRTAWAEGTITAYTYIYFGVSAVSLILNSLVLIAYCSSVRQANRTSSIASVWAGLIMASHFVIWSASIAVYRYGAEPVNGKFKDLWGWTCSTAANDIQGAVTDIDFSKYCTIQVSTLG